MSRLGRGVRVSVSFRKKYSRLVGRLRPEPRFVARIESGVQVRAEFSKKNARLVGRLDRKVIDCVLV